MRSVAELGAALYSAGRGRGWPARGGSCRGVSAKLAAWFGRECGGAGSKYYCSSPFPSLSIYLSLFLSPPLWSWLCFSLVFGWGVGLRPPRRGGGRTDGRLRARRAIWKTGGRVARPPSRRLPCLACLFCPRLALTVTGWVDWGASGRVWCLNGRRLPPSIFSGTAICSFPLSLSPLR